MIGLRNYKRRGFSLVELAIVVGVIGIVMASVWSYASAARQTQKIAQATQIVFALADDVRSVYAGRTSIVGGMGPVETVMVGSGSMLSTVLRGTKSACGTPAVTTYYADTPWGVITTDNCGSLHLCAWTYANAASYALGSAPNIGATPCASITATASAEYFAIEFTQLNYGSCVSLAAAIDPNSPSGLSDVYINGSSILNTGTGLPVVSAQSSALCVAGSTNVVDFVYPLRAPGT